MTTYTQAEYDTLKAAYASGAKRVKYSDGREVEYSRDEMKQILGEMEASLGTATVRRVSLLKFGRD